MYSFNALARKYLFSRAQAPFLTTVAVCPPYSPAVCKLAAHSKAEISERIKEAVTKKRP